MSGVGLTVADAVAVIDTLIDDLRESLYAKHFSVGHISEDDEMLIYCHLLQGVNGAYERGQMPEMEKVMLSFIMPQYNAAMKDKNEQENSQV